MPACAMHLFPTRCHYLEPRGCSWREGVGQECCSTLTAPRMAEECGVHPKFRSPGKPPHTGWTSNQAAKQHSVCLSPHTVPLSAWQSGGPGGYRKLMADFQEISHLAIKRNGPLTSMPWMVLRRVVLREKSPGGYIRHGAIYGLFLR